ncbi:carbon storage regulator CsrA [Luteimonas changyuni]|uniref:carbon storage regulator CsrA n=1 Tax=Luteimonas sp. MJ145 TaxID=3129234 RepID=UPI0031BBC644
MLVLSRQASESLVIGKDIVVTVVSVEGDRVRLGVEAPRDVPVHREEVAERIARQRTAHEPS